MSDIFLATPNNLVTGVIVTPPSLIKDSIKREVDRALAEIPAGKTGAIAAVATKDGVNLVIAYRDPVKGWEYAAFVGKSWGGGFEAGAQIKVSW